VAKTGRIEQNWANIFSDLRNKQIDVQNLNQILSFDLSIPGSSALTERVFSLISNKEENDEKYWHNTGAPQT
jgi:hypothetical protein